MREVCLVPLVPVVPKSSRWQPILLIAPLLILPVILLAATVPESQPSCSLQRGGMVAMAAMPAMPLPSLARIWLGLKILMLILPAFCVLLSMPPGSNAAQKEDVVPGFDAQPDSQPQPIFVSIELRADRTNFWLTPEQMQSFTLWIKSRFGPLACFRSVSTRRCRIRLPGLDPVLPRVCAEAPEYWAPDAVDVPVPGTRYYRE